MFLTIPLLLPGAIQTPVTQSPLPAHAPTYRSDLAPVTSLQFIQPLPKPDYTKSIILPIHAAQDALKSSCDDKNGTLSGVTCELPPPPTPTPQITTSNYASAGCVSWMQQAGINDIPDALTIVNMESGCNPNAVEPYSGACGIGQELPCGKWPGVWNDPVANLEGMQSYVLGRYGSWQNAVAFHEANGYY